MTNIDEEWANFCGGRTMNGDISITDEIFETKKKPISTKLYISTKTMISYISHEIDLFDVFWKLNVIQYHEPREGIVKKQMKFNTFSETNMDIINKHIQEEMSTSPNYIEEFIINKSENKSIGDQKKFKDVRKISIGLSKKDIVSYKCKKKGAFYNCFVVVIRVLYENLFREVHVKVFNTGKLEIPGIQHDSLLSKILIVLTDVIKNTHIKYHDIHTLYNLTETVLINSNFNCGYLINRDKLFVLLKYKYNINASYDSCSYPGIQCQFYHDSSLFKQTGKQPLNDTETSRKISFMVFRTGSVLIVGKCTEKILIEVYEFVKNMLEVEYENIGDAIIDRSLTVEKKEKKKRKKTLFVNVNTL